MWWCRALNFRLVGMKGDWSVRLIAKFFYGILEIAIMPCFPPCARSRLCSGRSDLLLVWSSTLHNPGTNRETGLLQSLNFDPPITRDHFGCRGEIKEVQARSWRSLIGLGKLLIHKFNPEQTLPINISKRPYMETSTASDDSIIGGLSRYSTIGDNSKNLETISFAEYSE